MARNLIKNPCGEEMFKHWEKVVHGGNGWKVEELPGECGAAFPYNGISKCFVSSFDCCSKTQVIDLLKEGYTEKVLDAQPNIVVSDWMAGRSDSGCCYMLEAQLLSHSREVISRYCIRDILVPPKMDGAWTQISHTFLGYGPGVRFIQFSHSGRDMLQWTSWGGARVTNSSVRIET